MKKKKAFPKKTALLLTAAAVLLAGSGIGSARAALTYYSENYLTQISTQDIGVTLLENDKEISSRDYNGSDWDITTGKLLEDMNTEGFKLAPGQSYNEVLKVENSGTIETYVRVIITKSWQDGNGKKDTSLDPSWIELTGTESGWLVDENQSTDERVVLYYTSKVPSGGETSAIYKSLRINNEIAADVTQVTNDDGSISYEYKYDDYSFTLDAEADAVQTHNAADAIKSAWGVTAKLDGDGNITSISAE